jgi:hypothetical protein
VAAGSRTFYDLVREAEEADVGGWDFSWLNGRATEERPPWGFVRLVTQRVSGAARLLDIQTGGGEFLSEVLAKAAFRPSQVAATESWPPNAILARETLAPYRVAVMQVADEGNLPFADASFDLVTSRHPVTIRWDEVARVLCQGGTYLGQHVGPGSNRELTDFLMSPQPVSDLRTPRRAVADAKATGLDVVDLKEASLTVEFFDIGAVVYFLRKVIWTVPGFTVAEYLNRLYDLHEVIRGEGRFVSHAQRFLIEASQRH